MNGTTTTEQGIEDLIFLTSLMSGVKQVRVGLNDGGQLSPALADLRLVKTNMEFSFSMGSLFLLLGTEEQISEDQKRGVQILVKNFGSSLENQKSHSDHRIQLKSIGELAKGIAHEINNPLTVIMGHCHNLGRKIERDQFEKESMDHAVKKMTSSAFRIESIVKSMKQFTGPRDPSSLEEVGLTDLITEAMDLIEEKFIHAGVEVKLHSVIDAKWFGNPIQLSQVLFNLLNNAYQAVETLEEKWVHVTLEVKADASFAIKVTDSGRGIEGTIAQKMMKPFFTTKSPDQGTGLGLSISKDIIDSYGGSLMLDEASQNTCFIIQLPLGG